MYYDITSHNKMQQKMYPVQSTGYSFFYFISSQTRRVYSTGSSMDRSAIRQAWE